MAFYLFLQLLRFRYNSIKPIEKLSTRQFTNSFNAQNIWGKLCLIVFLFRQKKDFTTNSTFLIPISLQPDVVYLCYFKL